MRITQSLLSSRSSNDKIIQSLLRSLAWAFLPSAAAILTLLLSTASSSYAGSAKWKASPATGDWNTAGNWTAGGPPNGSADTATFASSNIAGVSLSLNTEVNGIVFKQGASQFTITANPITALTISGVGITNGSGITQNFVTAVDGAGNFGDIKFTNSATAARLTVFTNHGASAFSANGGITEFINNSSAGDGTFINNGGVSNGVFGGVTRFFDTSTAGNGIFTTSGGAFGGAGGEVDFFNDSTAEDATITIKGGTTFGAQGGILEFYDGASAANGALINEGGAVSGAAGGNIAFAGASTGANATIIAQGGAVDGAAGGAIFFYEDATGGTARVEVEGNGSLDISSHNAPGVTTGSIEGSGLVFLGANNLTVGSSNFSIDFFGVIQDGGIVGGTGGSLTKIGTGTLAFSGANTYTGGTTIQLGTLLINTKRGSGAGSGNVQVNVGTLGGTGNLSGAVTVGTSSGASAFLSPASDHPLIGTLTIKKALTFNSTGTYQCELMSKNARADKIVAKGVTINNGATFSFSDLNSSTLPLGTVFTVIDNTATTPIAGTFSNLADGSTVTTNSNNFQANYEGGDGNDLTLTVVP
jgi:autotransporter-associated beta strand protein